MTVTPQPTSGPLPNQVWIFILAALLFNPTSLADAPASLPQKLAPEACVPLEVVAP